MGDVYHVTSDTRPSPFSMCNIEKVGVAWGRGYIGTTVSMRQANIHHKGDFTIYVNSVGEVRKLAPAFLKMYSH